METFIGKGIENLFALCDDGAIFAYSADGEWWKLPPIPQDKKDEDTDRKLAIAYGELAALRRSRNSERVAGMIAVKDLVMQHLTISDEEEMPDMFAAINALIEMNTPQSEGIAV